MHNQASVPGSPSARAGGMSPLITFAKTLHKRHGLHAKCSAKKEDAESPLLVHVARCCQGAMGSKEQGLSACTVLQPTQSF